MIWKPEDDDKLAHLRDEGLSYSEIGQHFGVSRNAISGRVNRLKLKPRTNEHSANMRWHGSGKPERKPKSKPMPLKPFTYRKGIVTPPRFFAILDAPNAVPVPLMERTGCCYPVTEHKPHLFCNAETDGSYCEFHRSLMYRDAA